MKLLNKLRSYDVYGNNITLNFNSKGNSHRTYVGGLCTFFSTLLLFMYCSQKILSAKDNDTQNFNIKMINPNNMGEVSLAEACYIPRF